MNDLRVVQRTPEEQDRHDRLSRVECESDYEEPDDDDEEDAQTEKQVTRHSINEEKHPEMMAKKWRKATDAAVAFRVFLKRQASEEHGKEYCDIMKNAVFPTAKETGWLEDIREEGLRLTKREMEIAENSYVNYVNNERGGFSFETLMVASTTRMFNGTRETTDADKVGKNGKQAKTTHRTTMDEEPKVTETHGVKHLNVFQRGIWRAIKNNPQSKAAVQQREFGI